MKKDEIILHILGTAEYVFNAPYILTLSFYEGKCEKTSTKMKASSYHFISNCGHGYEKPIQQAAYKADAIYSIGVQAARTQRQHRVNVQKAVDIILVEYLIKINKTIQFYQKALKNLDEINGINK